MSIIEQIERRANRLFAEEKGLTLIEDLSPEERKAALEDDIERKARYVRTPAGMRRFKQPIGSIIIPKGGGLLSRLRVKAPVFKGFDLVEDKKGNLYDVGKDDSTGKFVALKHNTWDDQIEPQGSHDDALKALDDKLGGNTDGPTKAPSKKPEEKPKGKKKPESEEAPSESPAAAKARENGLGIRDAMTATGGRIDGHEEAMNDLLKKGTTTAERDAMKRHNELITEIEDQTRAAKTLKRNPATPQDVKDMMDLVIESEKSRKDRATKARNTAMKHHLNKPSTAKDSEAKRKERAEAHGAPSKATSPGAPGSSERDAFIAAHPKLKDVSDYHKPKLQDLNEKNFQAYVDAVEGGKSPNSVGAIMDRVAPGASWNPNTEKWSGQDGKNRVTSPTGSGDSSASDATDAAIRDRVQKMKDEGRSKGRTNPYTTNLSPKDRAEVDALTPGEYAAYMNGRDRGLRHRTSHALAKDVVSGKKPATDSAPAPKPQSDADTMKMHERASDARRPFRREQNVFDVNRKLLEEKPDKVKRIRDNRLNSMEKSIKNREMRLNDPRYSGDLLERDVEAQKRNIERDKKTLAELRTKVNAMPKDKPAEDYVPTSQRDGARVNLTGGGASKTKDPVKRPSSVTAARQKVKADFDAAKKRFASATTPEERQETLLAMEKDRETWKDFPSKMFMEGTIRDAKRDMRNRGEAWAGRNAMPERSSSSSSSDAPAQAHTGSLGDYSITTTDHVNSELELLTTDARNVNRIKRADAAHNRIKSLRKSMEIIRKLRDDKKSPMTSRQRSSAVTTVKYGENAVTVLVTKFGDPDADQQAATPGKDNARTNLTGGGASTTKTPVKRSASSSDAPKPATSSPTYDERPGDPGDGEFRRGASKLRRAGVTEFTPNQARQVDEMTRDQWEAAQGRMDAGESVSDVLSSTAVGANRRGSASTSRGSVQDRLAERRAAREAAAQQSTSRPDGSTTQAAWGTSTRTTLTYGGSESDDPIQRDLESGKITRREADRRRAAQGTSSGAPTLASARQSFSNALKDVNQSGATPGQKHRALEAMQKSIDDRESMGLTGKDKERVDYDKGVLSRTKAKLMPARDRDATRKMTAGERQADRQARRQAAGIPEPRQATDSKPVPRAPGVDSTVEMANSDVKRGRRIRSASKADDWVKAQKPVLDYYLGKHLDKPMPADQQAEVDAAVRDIRATIAMLQEKFPGAGKTAAERRREAREAARPAGQSAPRPFTTGRDGQREYLDQPLSESAQERQRFQRNLNRILERLPAVQDDDPDNLAEVRAEDAPSVAALNEEINALKTLRAQYGGRTLQDGYQAEVDEYIKAVQQLLKKRQEFESAERAEFESANAPLF